MSFNIFDKVGRTKVLAALVECEKCCMIDGSSCTTMAKHHIKPFSDNGSNDWKNAMCVTPNNHANIHAGKFNGMTFQCVETWVLRYLGIDFETQIVKIESENKKGMGAGKTISIFIEEPTDEFHTPFLYLPPRPEKNEPNTWSPINKIRKMNKLARQTKIV